MVSKRWISVFISVIAVAQALICEKHDILKNYRVGQFDTLISTTRDTPPSKTIEKWWLNVCEEHTVESPEGCEKSDMLCGLTEITLPSKDAITTQIINFNKDIGFNVEEAESALILSLKSAKWGSNMIDAKLEFQCNDNMKEDEMVSQTWADKTIQLTLKGPSGCLKSKDDDKKKGDDEEKKPAKKSGGTSWFTWLFLYALLFTLIYLMVVSFLSTRGGSFQDFRAEFIQRSTQFFTSLPEFCREVMSKILGRNTTQRGGYSAV
ncbi:atg27p [Saccharomyces arboricola H-6]|uniref:Autophagy-related protein 27 n=1 Tax=Saccharomyces arboricola (strain H-6 / AS 2.3317 / CBS 10644) TaxID=1160507 RepID=J8Q0R5_SACAR|nr:atg27p [Saccharomyces arboricola H-6]